MAGKRPAFGLAVAASLLVAAALYLKEEKSAKSSDRHRQIDTGRLLVGVGSGTEKA